MVKNLKGNLFGLALLAASGSANAGLITPENCNLESVSNSNYNLCLDVDEDNNRLVMDLISTGNDSSYNIGTMNIGDLENPSFFTGNARIDYDLSSLNDRFGFLGTKYGGSNADRDNDLKLVLNITDDLKNEILSGDYGINYGVNFVNSSGGSTTPISGEGFYSTKSHSVDEGLNTLGGVFLGLGGIFLMNRRTKKILENSLN